MPKIYTVTVVEKVIETNDTITLKFKQPALKKIKYKAGQYITLIVRINGRTFRRPYSLSSAYGIDSTLDITVKLIKEGVVSSFLYNCVDKGDTFEIMEPMGTFVLPDGENNSAVLWSAGSGITPAWSLLKHLLHKEQDTKVTLIYCNRNESSVIFNRQLQELGDEFGKRLKVYYIFSQPETRNTTFFEGRISRQIVQSILSATPNSHSCSHFICGPIEMMDLIKEELFRDNIPERLVHFENFHNSVNQEDLAGVKVANVILRYQQDEYSFKVPLGKNILEACLDANIDFPYSCQTGSCTFCKATLNSGFVKTITHQKPEGKLNENECLLCCSYPLEEEITLQA